MNAVADQSVTKVKAEYPAPIPASEAVKAGIAAAHANDEQEIAALQARIVVLEKAVKGEKPEKKPIETVALEVAIAKLEADAASDLASDNPKARPSTSLLSVLGFIPQMTPEQRKAWNVRKDKMEKAHSDWHRANLNPRRTILQRLVRNPNATIGSVLRVRKDKTVARVALSAGERAKPRKPRKGKNVAKPAQPQQGMDKAPNANPPAQIK